MTEPVASPPPDLKLVEVDDLLDEISRRFGSCVLITEKSIVDNEGVIGVWSDSKTRDHEIIGLLRMADHWMLRDSSVVAFRDET